MVTLYYENEIEDILALIEDYISEQSADEQIAYRNELAEVKNDFVALVESGVFHDACGQVVDIKSDGLLWFAEVETEY